METNTFTVVRSPMGSWFRGERPENPTYRGCEIYLITADCFAKAKMKAQSIRSGIVKKGSPLPTQEKPLSGISNCEAKLPQSVSQRLRNRLEDDLGVSLPKAPERIWGESSSACRWFVSDRNGIEYLSYHPMSECVRSDVKLLISGSPNEPKTKFISIEPIIESKD
ncbi:hypothetical protein ACTG16_23480 [Aeromonas sp. 23P]|uniref:hypothetical protein n=1 Tax=Aeromonas sp. 23P TaxID=3452716 RepID=UPI003F7A74B1